MAKDNNKIKKEVLTLALELVKEGKNLLVQKQAYQHAAIIRDLERILTEDGNKLSIASLKGIADITNELIKIFNGKI